MQHDERKKRWILAVRRKSWNPTKHTRICGDHFVSGERIHGACGTEITRQYCCSGKPVEEPESVNYVPSIFSYNQHRRDKEAGRREQRRSRADRRRQILEIAEAEKENEMLAEEREKESHDAAVEGLLLLQQLSKVDVQTQTSPPVEDSDSLPSPVYPTTPTLLYVPVESAVSRPFGSKLLEGDDERTKLYTGLTSWSIFKHLVKFLSARCPSLASVHARLSPFNSILLTLMRLRLNLLMEDIAYWFNIGPSTASEIFSRNIDLMYAHLKFLIKWPSQEVCRANMPQVFKDLFPRTRCIIDCSEIFIERPCSYQARAQTYSNYKKHNTIKFLIGITPCGAVSYLSKCWGG